MKFFFLPESPSARLVQSGLGKFSNVFYLSSLRQDHGPYTKPGVSPGWERKSAQTMLKIDYGKVFVDSRF
jgi:hypothetical protein